MTKITAITFGHHDRTRLENGARKGPPIPSDRRRVSLFFTACQTSGAMAAVLAIVRIASFLARCESAEERSAGGGTNRLRAPSQWRPRSVRNARCPGLQDIADRGIYACNRVCGAWMARLREPFRFPERKAYSDPLRR